MRESVGKWAGGDRMRVFWARILRHTSTSHDTLWALRAARGIRGAASEASPSFRKFGVKEGVRYREVSFSADLDRGRGTWQTVDSSTAGPGRHHGRPGKWENRGLLGSSLDRVLDNDASIMLTTVWKRGKPAKMAVRAQENRACGAKKRRASRATRGLKRRPCGRPHTPVG